MLKGAILAEAHPDVGKLHIAVPMTLPVQPLKGLQSPETLTCSKRGQSQGRAVELPCGEWGPGGRERGGVQEMGLRLEVQAKLGGNGVTRDVKMMSKGKGTCRNWSQADSKGGGHTGKGGGERYGAKPSPNFMHIPTDSLAVVKPCTGQGSEARRQVKDREGAGVRLAVGIK